MNSYKLPITAASLAVTISVQAQIGSWTFETSVPTTAGPLAPEVGSGTATGFHAGASVYSNPAGNGSLESWSSTAWAVGDYYQFQVATTGVSGSYLEITWDQTSSGTGPRDFDLRYSLNGTSFTTLFSYSVVANASPNPTWNPTTASALYSFSADTSGISGGLINEPTVYFRLVDISTTSANGGTVAAGGTARVDNFTINAVAVPEPEEYAALVAGGLIGFGVLRRFNRK